MLNPSTTFPLSGVIGIVDSSVQQIQQALDAQLRCVEVRADLLQSAGLDNAGLMSLVCTAKDKGLAVLFTLRHADQGGTFNGAETVRADLCKEALEAGADIIDLEHGTDSAAIMLQAAAPMILSYHNFDNMLSAPELASLTEVMEQQRPAAIKIIPTGSTISDAASMLSWVSAAGSAIRRIGFSMGAEGGVSRILTLAHGSPVTYASFGEPVAPGQVELSLLLDRYHCNSMGVQTKIVALVGNDEKLIEKHVASEVANAASGTTDCVWIGFDVGQREMLENNKQALKLSDIQVL